MVRWLSQLDTKFDSKFKAKEIFKSLELHGHIYF